MEIEQNYMENEKSMWTQAEAIVMLSALEPELAMQGFHCALTGSVLYRGTSTKDLDVIIYPHHKKGQVDFDLSGVKSFLRIYFQSSKINDCSSTSQERDDKQVCWLKTNNQKRIDFFSTINL